MYLVLAAELCMSPGAGPVLVKVGGAKSVLMFASPAQPSLTSPG